MQRLMLLIAVSCALVTTAGAQPEDAVDRFEAGNDYVAAGDYEAAQEAYERVLDTGYTNGALHYNLGNVYFRLDALGPSIYQYEQARALLDGDPRITHNLRLARDRADVPAPTAPPGWHTIVTGLPAGLAIGLGLGLYLGGWLLIGYRRWRPQEARGGTWVYQGALAVGIALTIAGLGASYVQAMHEQAVVLDDQAVIHDAPGTGVTADTLAEGLTVRVLDRRPEWTRVAAPDDRTGWVPTASLGDL